MIDSMNYEYLLRRIYQVGRNEKKNIDADIYRELEHSESIYMLELENIKHKKPRIKTDNIEELEYDYIVQCRKVWHIVSDAINVGIEKYSNVLSNEEIKDLKDIIIEPKKIDKKDIDLAIKIAETIFVKHEIFPA